MKKIFLFLLFTKIILGNIPNYFTIKRNEQYNFTLSNKNSSFYAYLTSEEDSEKDNEDEDLDSEIYGISYGFLKVSKKLGVKSIFRFLNESFPDESEFNKTSSKYERMYSEINDNMKLAHYRKLYKQDNGMNLFVFYIKDEYLNSTMDNETFVFGRIGYPIAINETILEFELKPGEEKLFFLIIDPEEITEVSIVFINHPFSVLYFGYSIAEEKIEENLYLYDIPFPELETSTILVYNPENVTKKINFEFKIESSNEFREHRSVNLKYNKSDIFPIVPDFDPVIYIHTNKSENENVLLNFIWDDTFEVNYWYLNKNISEIKNLEDLKKIENYKYITNGNIYTNNNYVFLLFYIWNYLHLNVSVTNIEEKEQELDYFQFKYFKVSKGNILTFKKKYEENFIIIKLVSNNN